MAVYKVPQDVEADDKLIGPFSFRQFIYLIVVAIAAAGAWGLGQLFPVLAILPLPIILFFLALSLPLKKDQPMEAYLSAVVSFYFLKSHKRLWQPDGINSFVTIIPAKNSEKILTKGFDQTEADKRLSYLASLVDSHGWAIRGEGLPDNSLSTDLYRETLDAKDMMDETSTSAQVMAKQLQDAADSKKEEAKKGMQTAHKQTGTTETASKNADQPLASTLPSMDELRAKEAASTQKMVESQGRDAATVAMALAEEADENRSRAGGIPVGTTSASTSDTAKMELTKQQAETFAKQDDLTLATISHQAQRVASQNKGLAEGEEVTISLH
jgi:hypothetical protein